MKEFFSSLEQRLEEARAGDRERYGSFLTKLKPRLEAARELDRELNRHLAHRFNALRYLRTDELGLSRIIGDLLDPSASHGQGTLFLQTLLSKLDVVATVSYVDLATACSDVEVTIPGGRRIDIIVKVGHGDQGFCLAIENKPYAHDQKDQLRDYLKYLRNEYGNRFLMVYLSAGGEGPSDSSLPLKELAEWSQRLTIMSYGSQGYVLDDAASTSVSAKSGGVSPDPFQDYRTECSLAEWLCACREKCQAERMRWFLGETESFCKTINGGRQMPSDSETRELEKFLFADRENLRTARTVHEAWPQVEERVYEQFVCQLRASVEKQVRLELEEFAVDIHFGSRSPREKGERGLWLYRSSWRQYDMEGGADSGRRTNVMLGKDGPGPTKWWFGICSPLNFNDMSDADQKRRACLDKQFAERFGKYQELKDWACVEFATDTKPGRYPLYFYARENKKYWPDLLYELRKECDTRGGEITDYYVKTLVDLAKEAIPIIDEVESTAATE